MRMVKQLLLALFFTAASASAHAQLSLTKVVGKNADKYKLGYDVFSYIDIPVNEAGNQSVRIELLDLAFYPGKIEEAGDKNAAGYISVKLGYKVIFSETRTGFYLEPSFGYTRVVVIEANSANDHDYGDGIAAALEGGYNLEVGQNGHSLAFGLKYEADRAGVLYLLNSVGFRVSYAFNLVRLRQN